jgi:uncharacterized membrane protein SpoIIM required for sporulation
MDPLVSAHDLSRRIAVETPENVLLEFELAGVGSRAAATVLDTLLLFMLILALLLGTASFNATRNATAIWVNMGPWMIALVIAALFALVWGYYVLFETFGGRTVGKRALGIRVVMETGHPITFGAAASRNLLRLVDGQPGLSYLLGGSLVFFDSRHRRLGDLVAGTIVVRDRPEEKQILAQQSQAVTISHAVPAAEGPALPEPEFRFLEQYLTRRDSFAPAARDRLSSQLMERLAPRFPRLASELDFLERVYQLELDRRRSQPAVQRMGAPAQAGASGAERFAASKQESWNRFADATAQAERRGLGRFDGSAILKFAGGYREVAADLARARTYRADSRLIRYLERLVSSGHNVLYGVRGVRRSRLGALLFGEIPAAVIKGRVFVLFAALTFAVPAIVGYRLLRERPAIATEVLPDEMLARAEAGRTMQREGVGYAEMPSVFLPMLASRIITNNVQVAFGAFAFGISAGIGTLVVLIFNGLFLGSILGHFANRGVALWLLTFVVPHGVLEIPAIIIAGGAGLMIGYAIIVPGELTRRDALVVNGRLAIKMVGASACLLLIAGLIEGLLSASDSQTGLKMTTAAAALLLLVLYLAAGYGYAKATPSTDPSASRTPPAR